MHDNELDADVAIVGYGPVGVCAANFLGQYGVKTLVFERYREIYPRARAVTVNDWTMRAFQSVGLDSALRADMEVTGALNWKTYGGKTVFRIMPEATKLGLLIAGRDPKLVFLGNHLGPVLMRFPAVTRRLMPTVPPALSAGWLNGPLSRDSIVGRMLPQPPVCNARGRHVMLDDMLGDGFAVLAIGEEPQALMRESDIDGWRRLGARFIAVRSAGSNAHGDSDVIDREGTLIAWMRGYRSRVIAVRPDRFIAASNVDGMGTPTPVSTDGVRGSTHEANITVMRPTRRVSTHGKLPGDLT